MAVEKYYRETLDVIHGAFDQKVGYVDVMVYHSSWLAFLLGRRYVVTARYFQTLRLTDTTKKALPTRETAYTSTKRGARKQSRQMAVRIERRLRNERDEALRSRKR